MTMHAIDTFPDAALPLRERLPNLSPATRDKLIVWGAAQPGSLGWLLARTAAYWEKFPGAGDEHHQRLDATAALDLLRHRIARADDKAAVEHLNAPLSVPTP